MPPRSSIFGLSALAALALSACDATPTVKTTTTTTIEAETPAATLPLPPASAAPLTPAGAPVALVAATEESLQWAASVVRVDPVGDGVKLFGVAGGDPAMNGLQTYIAFYRSPAEGWAVYPIGDILDYTVQSRSDGRVDLELHESDYDGATGQIGDRRRKVIVQWTAGDDGAAPSAVTVTPGR